MLWNVFSVIPSTGDGAAMLDCISLGPSAPHTQIVVVEILPAHPIIHVILNHLVIPIR